MKRRIGFLSYWGFGRGMSYVTLNYAKMLIPDYDVFILKQGLNSISEEFKIDVNVTEYSNYLVDPKMFEQWLVINRLDAIVFNEYNQWITDPNNLIQIAKKHGVKTYGYLVMERFEDINKYAEYDRIISPTNTFKQFLRSESYFKSRYVPVSVDFNEFPEKKKEKNEYFTFFHPAGYGGVMDRKNTDNVVNAFKQLLSENPSKKMKLILSSQKDLKYEKDDNIEIITKDLNRKELIDLYYKADVVLLPSKWETVGLPIQEALASGTPVITTDMPPMKEFVKEGLNGFLCKPREVIYPNIMIKVAEVDTSTLKIKMEASMNEMLLEVLTRNSRKIAFDKYNNEKNRHYFIDMLKEDLGEDK